MYGMDSAVNTTALSLTTFLDTIDRTFFTPKFGTYENLTFFNDPTMFKLIMFGLYFGIVAAAIFMCYTKRVLGAFVRKLDESGALSKENAKTLAELGFEKNIFVKLALISGYTLRRVTNFVPAPAEDAPKKKAKKLKKGAPDVKAGGNLSELGVYGYRPDLKRDAFYIPEEKRDVTVGRFEARGSGIVSVIAVAVIGIIVVAIIFKFAPVAVAMLDSFVGGFKNEPDVLN